MKVRREMKIEEVLAMNEQKVLNTLAMVSVNFERLRNPTLRRAMSRRVSIEQAARVARVPLTEILYVLNLALGEDEAELAAELFASEPKDFEYADANLPVKPAEIANVKDTDENVIFTDLMPLHETASDPLPAVMKALAKLKDAHGVLLLRHPFDPIPLRELFARRYNLASWAEERKESEWFVYFYRPFETAKVKAHAPINHKVFARAACAAR